MTHSRYELKRIGLFSAIKTLFLLGGFAGFLIGLFQWMAIWMMYAAMRSMPESGAMPYAFELELLLESVGGGGGMIFPLLGGFMGSIAGIIAAGTLGGLYNIAARVWGGLEFEWREVRPSTAVIITAPAMVTTPGQPTPLPGEAPTVPTAPPDETKRNPDDDDDAPPRRTSTSTYE